MNPNKLNVSNGSKSLVEVFEIWVDLLDNKYFEKIDDKIQSGELNPNVSLINGLTPLHIACIEGNIEGIRYLLNLNVDIYALSKMGKTPLQEAVFYGHKDCINLLSQRMLKDKRKSFENHC